MKHMKKIIALALVIASVCTFALSASADTKWVDASGWLNFRSSYSTSSTLLDKIADGLPVYEHSLFYANGYYWSYVTFDGTTGYCMTMYLTTTNPGYTTPQNMRQAFGYYLLQSGSSGFRVKNLQRALYSGGYYTGSIDGNFGSATVAAVRNYQDDEGLTVDGLVGDITKTHLWNDYSGALMSSGYVQ